MSTSAPLPQTDRASIAYDRLVRRKSWWLAAAGATIVLSVSLDIMVGPMKLSPMQMLATILHPGEADEFMRVTVWTHRLPPALMAVLIGCALGLAGAVLQTILNNPLASPFTLGVSAAAGFGAALAIVCGAGIGLLAVTTLIPASAFLFAMLGVGFIYALARLKRGATESMILGGIALHFLFSSGIAFLQYVANGDDKVRAIVFWTFGSLQGATWPKLGLLAGVFCCVLPLVAAQAWKLTALRTGESRARALGVDTARLRMMMLGAVSILTATAVCFAGTIGFIGLVAPHLARMTVGEDQRFLLPGSALAGALVLSVASIATKSIDPGASFPIGIATAFIGVPFFAVMILTRRRGNW